MSIQSAEVHRRSGSGSGSDHAPICALALAPRTAQPPRRSDRPAGRGVAAASGKMVPTSDVPAKLTLLLMLLIAVIDHGEAGTCWLRRFDSSGKCSQLFARNVTRESCCGAGASGGKGYSERDIPDVGLFFLNAFNDGMECTSCLDTCDRTKCGPNKRCVMRRNRPKCICAPSCSGGSNKRRPQTPRRNNRLHQLHQQQHQQQEEQPRFHQQNIKVINLSESQRGHRQYFADAGRQPRPRQLRYTGPEKGGRSVKKTSLSENRPPPPPADGGSQRASAKHGAKDNAKARKHNLLESVTLAPRPPATARWRASVRHRPAAPVRQRKDTVLLLRHRSHPTQRDATIGRVQRCRCAVATRRRANKPTERPRPWHRLSRSGSQSCCGCRGSAASRTRPRCGCRAASQTIWMTFSSSRTITASSDAIASTRAYRSRMCGATKLCFYNPVCGTDGRTYKTECQLKKRACRQEITSLMVAYKGHCQTSCKFVQCPDGKRCIEDQNATPHCVSCGVAVCRADRSPKSVVCGTDGITYPSICELKRQACLNGRAIPVAYRGRCTIKCKDRQHCLTDLKTHKPRCVSCSYKCPRSKRQQGYGKLYRDAKNVPFYDHNVKLCGTNNRTYHSWCHMQKDSCTTGFYIDVQYGGSCAFGR
ncbi:AGAP006282-PA [Anopheles gambiae str. PEST]|uniref:AGAP006282-PA n=1 Tax=Anopheles gambiae TaxID=7165 RepID=Q7PP79_ANOGA|nr:AGAP006282-PA [Anopheles gambiae str. PEST]